MDAPLREQPLPAGQIVGRFQPAALRSLLQYVVELVFAGIVYLGVAKLSLMLASINPSASPVWPVSGYALGVVLLRGYRICPAIFVAALIANATTAGSLYTSLGIATGNTLESLVGAYVINRWSGGLATFDTPGGVAKFALVCLVPSTMISATVGVVSLSLGGYADWSNFRTIWTTWWMGDLAGALVITPAFVLWGTAPSGPMERQELIQTAIVYAAAIAVGLLAFSPLIEQSPTRTPLAFLAILPLMWAALRRNQRDTATTALLTSCFAVWGAIANDGPFVRGSLNETFLLLLGFMISVSVPSLALSAEVAVRKRHEEHVDFVMHELSHRTKNLLAIVQSMANQVARHTDEFETFFIGFSTRLRAFAETHDLLVQDEWHGVDLRELVRIQLAPFQNLAGNAILVEGPDLKLNPQAAEQMGLALHELGTNAAKHGALSASAGVVKIFWELEAHAVNKRHLRFTWTELGGPPVAEPLRQGFGRLVIGKIVPTSLQGTASLSFDPEGVRWMLLVPTTHMLA